MTDSDEDLSRLFIAQAPERDMRFADAVEVRLKWAYLARLSVQALRAAFLAMLAVGGWYAWKIIGPVITLAVPYGANFSLLGAPAPAVALLAMAGLWFAFRRFIRALA